MARFRDVSDVDIFGTRYVGVQSVEVGVEGDELSGSGDEAQSLRYLGISDKIINLSIELLNSTLTIAPGDTGTISFTVPQAVNSPTTGTRVTIGNVVTNTVSGSQEHGALADGSMEASAYSSDGTTSPISLVTGVPITATTLQESDFLRDVGNVTWTPEGGSPISLNEVMSVEFTKNSDTLQDSAEDDAFITSLLITNRSIDVSLSMRDINQVLGDENFAVCKKGSLTYRVFIGKDDTGCADPTSYKTVTINNLEIMSTTVTATHADYAEGTIDFKDIGTASAEADIIVT